MRTEINGGCGGTLTGGERGGGGTEEEMTWVCITASGCRVFVVRVMLRGVSPMGMVFLACF